MADAGFITADAADRASREPLQVAARSLENEAPYFVDYIGQELQDRYKATGAVDVYTTLDVHLQKIAQDAVREGLAQVDEILARRKRQRAQAALVAIDPRTGEILALVGGRSYNQSQYNRATTASRQPGSVFKPFVYLAAFEQAREQGRTDITPATVVLDEPTTWEFNAQTWSPANYDGEYEGPVTLRRALALSRNIPTIKVAETTGYDQVAAIWKTRWRRHTAAPVSVDRAWRVRGDAPAGGGGVHAVHQRRHHTPVARPVAYRERREGPRDPRREAETDRAVPIPRSSSRTCCAA